jgi:ribosome assembly protein YihI (activator of Der GTPase)
VVDDEDDVGDALLEELGVATDDDDEVGVGSGNAGLDVTVS